MNKYDKAAQDIRKGVTPYTFAMYADVYMDNDAAKDWVDTVVQVALDEAEPLLTDPYETDYLHELADSVVPIYNHERMDVTTGTRAFFEDVSDYGTPDNMLDMAGVALYMQAERIMLQVMEAVREELDNMGDEEADNE